MGKRYYYNESSLIDRTRKAIDDSNMSDVVTVTEDNTGYIVISNVKTQDEIIVDPYSSTAEQQIKGALVENGIMNFSRVNFGVGDFIKGYGTKRSTVNKNKYYTYKTISLAQTVLHKILNKLQGYINANDQILDYANNGKHKLSDNLKTLCDNLTDSIKTLDKKSNDYKNDDLFLKFQRAYEKNLQLAEVAETNIKDEIEQVEKNKDKQRTKEDVLKELKQLNSKSDRDSLDKREKLLKELESFSERRNFDENKNNEKVIHNLRKDLGEIISECIGYIEGCKKPIIEDISNLPKGLIKGKVFKWLINNVTKVINEVEKYLKGMITNFKLDASKEYFQTAAKNLQERIKRINEQSAKVLKDNNMLEEKTEEDTKIEEILKKKLNKEEIDDELLKAAKEFVTSKSNESKKNFGKLIKDLGLSQDVIEVTLKELNKLNSNSNNNTTENSSSKEYKVSNDEQKQVLDILSSNTFKSFNNYLKDTESIDNFIKLAREHKNETDPNKKKESGKEILKLFEVGNDRDKAYKVKNLYDTIIKELHFSQMNNNIMNKYISFSNVLNKITSKRTISFDTHKVRDSTFGVCYEDQFGTLWDSNPAEKSSAKVLWESSDGKEQVTGSLQGDSLMDENEMDDALDMPSESDDMDFGGGDEGGSDDDFDFGDDSGDEGGDDDFDLGGDDEEGGDDFDFSEDGDDDFSLDDDSSDSDDFSLDEGDDDFSLDDSDNDDFNLDDDSDNDDFNLDDDSDNDDFNLDDDSDNDDFNLDDNDSEKETPKEDPNMSKALDIIEKMYDKLLDKIK